MRFHTQTAGVSLTAQQPLNNIVRTAIEALGRRARRHAVAAHQFLRRGAGAPDRAGGPRRAADPADHRRGDRRGEHDRSARRLVPRRGADRSDGGAGVRVLREDRRSSAGWSRRSSGASRSARSPTPRSATSRRSSRASASVVGVNAYTEGDDLATPILRIDPQLEGEQIRRVRGGPGAARRRRRRRACSSAASRPRAIRTRT